MCERVWLFRHADGVDFTFGVVDVLNENESLSDIRLVGHTGF